MLFHAPLLLVPQRDKWRRTPLHRAAKEGHKDVVAALLGSGAEVNAQVGQQTGQETPERDRLQSRVLAAIILRLKNSEAPVATCCIVCGGV